MHNILVTGGLGFIGSNLIEFLLKKKYRILNIDKVSYASNFYNTKNFKHNNNYKFIKNDLSDSKKIFNIIKNYKPKCIFHLAAETHVDRSIKSPKNFIESNIVATFNLLEAFKNYSIKNKKTKLIHVSTDEVYGDILKGRSLENDSYKPSSPYSASKASSNHLVYSYIKTYKVPAIITNCSNNYGPRQHSEKYIPKIIFNMLHNKNLPIYGKGLNSREWIYVEDHCNALYKIFQRGKIGEIYNIGSNLNLNNIELAKKLIKIAKTKIKIGTNVKIRHIKDRPGHDYRYALNSNKLKKKLNWKIKIDISNGLKKTFNWYLDNQEYFLNINKRDINKRFG